MSIRQSLLALLTEQPKYGAQLRADFETRTGGTWPLNVGQVYTTLGRLERDGLVIGTEADPEGRIAYQLTATGRAAVADWWLTPVDRDEYSRDEVAIKLALAVTVDGVDVPAVVQTQRSQSVRSLTELTRLKRLADAEDDLSWLLVLEHLIFAAEAEIRWLDHVESMLARQRPIALPDASGAVFAPSSPSATATNSEPTR
jgi:DNA-binding PadR family transcriptional regulator